MDAAKLSCVVNAEKKLLEAKLYEFYELAKQKEANTAITSKESFHDQSKPTKKAMTLRSNRISRVLTRQVLLGFGFSVE